MADNNSVVVRLVVRDDGTVELKRFQSQLAATKVEAESLGRSGMTLGTLFDSLDGRVGNLSTQLGRLNANLASASGTLRRGLLIGLRDVTLGLTAAAGAATYFGLKAVNSFQHTQAAFSVLTGSMANGQRLYNQLMALNLKSPFDQQPLASSAQTLLGFGFTGNNVLPLLRNISNVAAVQQDPNEALTRMSLAVGQIHQSGILRAQDLNQLVQAGFPAYSMIPGGHAGLLAGGGSMPSAAFISALSNPNNPSLQRYGGAAQAMNQTLSGQWSNLTTLVRQSAIQAFTPMANQLVKQMPGLTKELQGMTKDLAPDIATFGGDIISGVEHLLPILEPIVKSLLQGFDKLASAGDSFFSRMDALDPKIVASLDDFFSTLAGETPEIIDLFGGLVGLMPAFATGLDVFLKLADPILAILNTMLKFKPLRDIFGGLLAVLLAYKTLDGPVAAIWKMTQAMRGMATAENALAIANVREAETSGLPGRGGVGGAGGSGKLGRLLGGLFGASMLVGPGTDVAHNKWGLGDDASTLLGGAATGFAFGGPFGALAGGVLGGSADLGVHVARWIHGPTSNGRPLPPVGSMYYQRLDALSNDPKLGALLARGRGSINVGTGAIVVHAAPGMDEDKLARKIRQELDDWIAEQQQRQ